METPLVQNLRSEVSKGILLKKCSKNLPHVLVYSRICPSPCSSRIGREEKNLWVQKLVRFGRWNVESFYGEDTEMCVRLRKRKVDTCCLKEACLSVSCLQMVDCHNFTHFCAVSLKTLKSLREQGVLSSGHCSRYSIDCVSVPQLHEGSPVWYSRLFKFALVRPTPDLSRLSVFHVGQGALLSGGRLSDG